MRLGCYRYVLGCTQNLCPFRFQSHFWWLEWFLYLCWFCLIMLSHVQFFATPWTVAHQAPLSMGFPKQKYWSGLPLPTPGDLPHLGITPRSPALASRFFTTEPPGKLFSVKHLPFRLKCYSCLLFFCCCCSLFRIFIDFSCLQLLQMMRICYYKSSNSKPWKTRLDVQKWWLSVFPTCLGRDASCMCASGIRHFNAKYED